jgi:hypothetical protein
VTRGAAVRENARVRRIGFLKKTESEIFLREDEGDIGLNGGKVVAVDVAQR